MCEEAERQVPEPAICRPAQAKLCPALLKGCMQKEEHCTGLGVSLRRNAVCGPPLVGRVEQTVEHGLIGVRVFPVRQQLQHPSPDQWSALSSSADAVGPLLTGDLQSNSDGTWTQKKGGMVPPPPPSRPSPPRGCQRALPG